MTRPARIISGGQTGADLGALRAGLALGYQPGSSLGGWMPRGFLNELGARPWMHTMYGMREHPSPQYAPRTLANLREADCTILFGSVKEPGCRLTYNACRREGRTVFVNPQLDHLLGWIGESLGTVNVAGNRESGNRGIEAYVYRVLIEAWGTEAEKARLRPAAPWPDPLPRVTDETGAARDARYLIEAVEG